MKFKGSVKQVKCVIINYLLVFMTGSSNKVVSIEHFMELAQALREPW